MEESGPDRLAVSLDRVRKWAASEGVVLVFGTAEDQESYPVITSDDEGADPLLAFLEAIKAARTSVLVVTTLRLDSSHVEEALDLLESLEIGAAERRDAASRIERCKAYFGQVALLEIRACIAAPPIFIDFNRQAEWYDVVFDTEETFAGDDAAAASGPDIERLTELAHKVASAPDFFRLRNKAERRYFAERVLKSHDGISAWETREIADRASTVFKTEILPAVTADVGRLVTEGKSPSEIASALAIQPGFVDSILPAIRRRTSPKSTS